MTLKDRFDMTMVSFLIEPKQDTTLLDYFEKITDEYAIEFGEWLLCRGLGETDLKLVDGIIEKFKKEKGL